MTITFINGAAIFAVGFCAGIIVYRWHLERLWRLHQNDIFARLAAALNEKEGRNS